MYKFEVCLKQDVYSKIRSIGVMSENITLVDDERLVSTKLHTIGGVINAVFDFAMSAGRAIIDSVDYMRVYHDGVVVFDVSPCDHFEEFDLGSFSIGSIH